MLVRNDDEYPASPDSGRDLSDSDDYDDDSGSEHLSDWEHKTEAKVETQKEKRGFAKRGLARKKLENESAEYRHDRLYEEELDVLMFCRKPNEKKSEMVVPCTQKLKVRGAGFVQGTQKSKAGGAEFMPCTPRSQSQVFVPCTQISQSEMFVQGPQDENSGDDTDVHPFFDLDEQTQDRIWKEHNQKTSDQKPESTKRVRENQSESVSSKRQRVAGVQPIVSDQRVVGDSLAQPIVVKDKSGQSIVGDSLTQPIVVDDESDADDERDDDDDDDEDEFNEQQGQGENDGFDFEFSD